MTRNKNLFRKIAAVVLVAIAVTGCGTDSKSKNDESSMAVAESPSKTEIPDREFSSAEEFEAHVDQDLEDSTPSSSGSHTDASIIDDFADVTDEMLENVPDLETITQEEFAALNLYQFKAFMAKYSPEYRSVYGIQDDKVMEEEDWTSLKSLVNYRLFGTLWFDVPKESENESVFTEEEKQNLLKEAKIDTYNITNEDIESIVALVNAASDEEFVLLIEEIFTEQGYDVSELQNMSAEDIQVFKEQLIKELNSYKTVDESDADVDGNDDSEDNVNE